MNKRPPASCVSVEDIDKLTAENRRLQIDIEYIGKEIAEEKSQQASSAGPGGNVTGSDVGNGGSRSDRPGGGAPSSLGDAENFHNNIGWSGQSGRPLGTGVPSPAPSRSGSTRRGGGDGLDGAKNWECPACTFRNHPDMDKCEMCEMPRFKGSMVPPGHGHGCYCHPPG